MADFAPSTESPGLPPVVPPSGRMIAQLFVIPGVIVIGVVTVILGFTWLAGGPRTEQGYLDGLRSPNAEIRWRTASDLAQVLQSNDELASNPDFGLRLAGQLQDALVELKKPAPPKAKDVEDDKRKDAAAARTQFENRRAEAQYLTACMGSLSIPVGAPLLSMMAGDGVSPDAETDAILRRQAAWALGRLGHNRNRYNKLSAERQVAVPKELDVEAGRAGDRANWAQAAAEALRGQGSAGAIAGLAKSAEADDPYLRKHAALALSFWPGRDQEAQLAEDTLMRLTRDGGQGTIIRLEDKP